MLIAVILGPLAETSLRRALAISEGDPGALFSSGLTITLYSLLLLGLVWAAMTRLRNRAQADI